MTAQTETPKKPSMDPWKLQMLQLTIIYRILECDDKLPMNMSNTDYEFVETVIQDMSEAGLLIPSEDSQYWECTDKAKELRKAMVQMYDHATQFEIFSTVHLDKNVGITDDMSDPRFEKIPDQTEKSKDDLGTEDMRIAMIRYVSAYAAAASEDDTVKEISPYIIVFMQMLSDGKLKGDIWFDLKCGLFFGTIQSIVESAYDWKNASDTEDGCKRVMGIIYTAGMLEMQKREEEEDSDDEEDDDEDVVTTTAPTEEVWSSDMVYYGYTPYDYYNPYNPLADALVFCGTVALFDTMCYDYTYGGLYRLLLKSGDLL